VNKRRRKQAEPNAAQGNVAKLLKAALVGELVSHLSTAKPASSVSARLLVGFSGEVTCLSPETPMSRIPLSSFKVTCFRRVPSEEKIPVKGQDSWHTRGFYERAAALYHHARGTPQKKLFWVPMSGERWRIDWQRTNRAVPVFGDAVPN